MSEYCEIVLTGSPGAGKSSAISDLARFLQEEGYRVLAAPEIATLLWSGGLSDRIEIASEDPGQYQRIQEAILSLHLAFRRELQDIARGFSTEKPVCIIYDRGPWDSRPYMQKEPFLRLFSQQGLDPQDIKEGYDLVVHMRSAATLDHSLYSTANNPHRKESAEEAERVDKRALEAWVGHPHLRIVEAMPTIEEKLAVVRSLVLQTLQGSETPEVERKFLLSSPPSPFLLQEAGAARVDIEQTYLLAPEDVERRVRKRMGRFGVSYHLTEKREASALVRYEKEQQITKEEYEKHLQNRDPGLEPLRKTRYHFVHSYHHLELDHFPDGDLWVLEIELHSPSGNYSLPEWLQIDREVTDDPSFRSRSIAQKRSRRA